MGRDHFLYKGVYIRPAGIGILFQLWNIGLVGKIVILTLKKVQNMTGGLYDNAAKRGSSHVYTSMCYYMLVLMLSLREGAVMYILVSVITC